jgi:hypothetical protein
MAPPRPSFAGSSSTPAASSAGHGALKTKQNTPTEVGGCFLLETSGSEKVTFGVFRPLPPMSCSLQQMCSCTATSTSQLKPIPSASSPSRALRKCLWARGPSRHCTRTVAGRRAGPPEPRARRWESCARSLPACLPACQLAAGSACGPLVLDSMPNMSW